jgi:cellulose biosynthesis protein BcsQ
MGKKVLEVDFDPQFSLSTSLGYANTDDELFTMGGVSDVALSQYLVDHPEIEKIKLGLGNDQVGNDACNQLYLIGRACKQAY